MRVTLINYTPDALETLIFTKGTRLKMAPTGLEDIKAWPMERKLKELDYMLGTIQSSWEFVDYVFLIEDVTRAFTHQLVRHRAGTSFAQQAQRAVDMTGFHYVATGNLRAPGEQAPRWTQDVGEQWPGGEPPVLDVQSSMYDLAMLEIERAYAALVAQGVPPQDARGLLPTNIATNIVFKANLRTLHDMGLKRLCVKAQGEFQDVFRAIKAAVVAVHPWADQMIKVHCAFHGTCCFPTFPAEECPVKPYVHDPVTGRAYGGRDAVPLHQIESIWQTNRAEAQPRV